MKTAFILILAAGCGARMTLGEAELRIERVQTPAGMHFSAERVSPVERLFDGARARHAIRTPAGDWVLVMETDERWVVRLAADGTVRFVWRAPGEMRCAASGEEIACVGPFADSTPPRLYLFGEEAAPFREWPIDRIGNMLSLAASGSTWLVIGRGIAAYDREGALVYRHLPAERAQLMARAFGNAIYVAGQTERGGGEREVCFLEMLDPESGFTLHSREIAGTRSRCTMRELIVHRGRVIVRYTDLLYRDRAPTQESHSMIAVFGAATLEDEIRTRVDTMRASAPFEGPLGDDDVVFLDTYASTPDVLEVHVFDAAFGTLRTHWVWMPIERDGRTSFVQLIAIASDGGTIQYAGIFAGELRGERGRLTSTVRGSIAPFAAIFGELRLRDVP